MASPSQLNVLEAMQRHLSVVAEAAYKLSTDNVDELQKDIASNITMVELLLIRNVRHVVQVVRGEAAIDIATAFDKYAETTRDAFETILAKMSLYDNKPYIEDLDICVRRFHSASHDYHVRLVRSHPEQSEHMDRTIRSTFKKALDDIITYIEGTHPHA